MKAINQASFDERAPSELNPGFATTRDFPERAQVSLRLVTLLEIASILGSVLLVLWGIAPLVLQARWAMVPPAFFAFLLIAYSIRLRRESLHELGLSRQNFLKALQMLTLPTVTACAIMLLAGYVGNSIRRSTHFELNLIVVPIWGVAQQFVLQGVIYRRLRQLIVPLSSPHSSYGKRSNWAIFLTACIFGFVHLPNPALTILTFLASLMWSWVYERAPNLWALGLSHGFLSLCVMHTLPAWFLQSMSVGYKHFLYQKF